MAIEEFENQKTDALSKSKDFCYETNFSAEPIQTPTLFRNHGYRIILVFFCLDSIDLAMSRVATRVSNGGHNVAKSEIISRFYSGYKNLNNHWAFFDQIHLFENSLPSGVPQELLSLSKRQYLVHGKLPAYLKKVLPNIFLAVQG